MSIVIREARDTDLDAAARILVAAFERYRPAPDAPVATAARDAFERYLRDIGDVRSRLGGSDLFVAVEEERILGAATLYRPNQPLTYVIEGDRKPWPAEWASLRLLAVDPGHRGRGIGRLLAEARIERARTLGAPAIGLHTSPGFVESYAMYLAMGWQRAPEYDYSPGPGMRAEALIYPLQAR